MTIRKSITVSEQLAIGKNLKLESDGGDYTITLSYADDSPISVAGTDASHKVTLTVENAVGTLTFDGNGVSRSKALINASFANVTLGKGVTVQNALNSANGGVLYLENGSIASLNDGVILQDNKAKLGSVAYIKNGQILAYECQIGRDGHPNHATSNAAIYLASGNLHLYDGAKLSYNTSASSGAAIYSTGIS